MALSSVRCAFTLVTSTSGAAFADAVVVDVVVDRSVSAAAAGSVPQPSATARERLARASLRFTLFSFGRWLWGEPCKA
ncbi:hypothetical protein SGRIM128S_08300 [Streptomyces griseomycini]